MDRKYKLIHALAAFVYAASAMSVATADDTEIFFGVSAPADSYRPNVLFMLDTSGSMGETVPGTGMSRLDNMKAAFHRLLDSVTNVNVGLMRFNDPGGPILFPTKNVDAVLESIDPDFGDGLVSVPIASGRDDVEKNYIGIVVDEPHLEMASAAIGDSGSIDSAASGDAEEAANGSVSLYDDRLSMQEGNLVGIRFDGIAVPRNATINSAQLRFSARESDDDDVRFTIYAEATGDSSAFSAANGNVSGRNRSSSSVDWQPAQWSYNGTYYTPDIGALVDEIVSRNDWSAGQALSLFIEHQDGQAQCLNSQTGQCLEYERVCFWIWCWNQCVNYEQICTEYSEPQRVARSSEDSSEARRPRLQLDYTAASMSGNTVGLRFKDVAIPQGATITSARIQFQAAEDEQDPVSLTIKGVAADDVADDEWPNAALYSLGRTSAVSWQVNEHWQPDQTHSTTDITNAVQEIVNRTGWCGGNNMAFEITGENEDINRVAKSFESGPSDAAVLKVTFDPESVPANGGCIQQWKYYRITDGHDDAEESSNGNVTISDSRLEIDEDQTIGLRFRDVDIPAGAEIYDARLVFTARDSDDRGVDAFIEAATDNSAFEDSSDNISDRPTTGVRVTWDLDDWNAGASYESPDLSAVLASVTDGGAWAAGDDLVLVVTANDSYGDDQRRAQSFEGASGSAPLLKVRFGYSGGGTFTYTVRDQLRDLVDDFTASGWTPVVDTYFEAASYYRGQDVLYGRTRGAAGRNGRVSHPLSYVGGVVDRDVNCTDENLSASACSDEEILGDPIYESPIIDPCQSSYIVMLTDGEANRNSSASLIRNVTGTSSCQSSSAGEYCGRELASFLANSDQSQSIEGPNFVRTYTIGFNLDQGGNAGAIEFLQDLADLGEGEYSSASTADELAEQFLNIVSEILSVNTTFVAPAVTVNQFNRTAHRDELYFSVFKPEDHQYWSGNLKRYALNSSSVIVDVHGADAVNRENGFFKADSQSYWSPAVDGPAVEEGGAASRMPASRRVYTYLGVNADLTASANTLSESNLAPTGAISKSMLGMGAETDAAAEEVLSWARGVDVHDFDGDGDASEMRLQIGDPLHSSPVVLTYGGTEETPDSTVFFGTNEGFLHAVDADTGVEQFAFIPQELLVNLKPNFDNQPVIGSRRYGLDGDISAWVYDHDANGEIGNDVADKVHVYFGMRRGGRSYYALDVTNRDAPRFLWQIRSGVGGYDELGQTWSKPRRTKVRIGANVKDVLIFGGGYDPDNDVNTIRSQDSEGRAVYIADALTGDLLWSGSPDPTFGSNRQFLDMNYSIPSDIAVRDADKDGLADQLYVGDAGAQLWRFDIHHGETGADLVTGAVIADFGEDDSLAGNRKFYNQPDLVVTDVGGTKALTVLIGSGWRAHPLDTSVDDRFYALRLSDVYAPPEDNDDAGTEPNYPGPYTEADLYDATDNLIGEGTEAERAAALNTLFSDKVGWYIRMEDSGEKVLSSSVTFNGTVLFTSYAPSAPTSVCGAAAGGGWLYAINLLDAIPVLNLDGTGDAYNLTQPDRRRLLGRLGIPPSPKLVFPRGGPPTVTVGSEQPLARGEETLLFGELSDPRLYWLERYE